ncbi:MAG: hypothetical protein K8U03_24970 [Planctomycetia bacterium]|nr:hypothetical protein [Planctomycetia bacterium]
MAIMDQQQLTKVDAAVQECLDACRESHTPFTHLASCLEKLKADASWSEDELREFQLRVVRVLL